jgi:lipopolysaccharide transport system permease protein
MSIWQERIHVFFQYKDLLKQLVKRDVKLKYRRSILGYVWSILNPLMIMVIMTLVFSAMFNRKIENYPVYLITGRTLFEFMTSSTNAAMRSIIGNGALLKKCYVPKYIFPLAKVTSSLVDLVFSMGALLIVLVFTRTPITPYILLAPLVMLQLYLFCCGLGFLLASLNVFFRDVQHIYKAITTAWMYLTPLFYPIDQLPDKLRFCVKAFNPMYYYVAQFRDLIYSGRLPGPRIFWGGWIIGIVMFIIGIIVFKKKQDKFILYI